MASAQPDLTAAARIRNTALELFARKGAAATSIRELAAEAGVSAGLVQHHFPSKRALTEAVNQHVVAIARDLFAEAPIDGSPAAVHRELGDRITELVRDQPAALLYVARAAADGDEGALQIFDAFVGIAKEHWRRLADAGLLDPDADLAWAPLHVVVLNLGTVLLSAAISRHLPDQFFSPDQLERWNAATSALFERGLYRS
jgi:AcrR family transcriptional regulator